MGRLHVRHIPEVPVAQLRLQRGISDARLVDGSRRQIWFDGPDEAYLVAAALARHLDGSIVADVFLVPTPDHGPALEVSSTAAADPLVQALVRRFGGHIDGEAIATRLREATGG